MGKRGVTPFPPARLSGTLPSPPCSSSAPIFCCERNRARNLSSPSPRRGENGTMTLDRAVNIEDLHRMAKRRLPKIAFDFIEGGLEDERGLGRKPSAFHKHG